MTNPIVTDKYTLYLGDCLEYMKTMPDKSVDAVITDPPYGIGYSSSRTTNTVGDKRVTDCSFGDDIYNPVWLPEIGKKLTENSLVYVFTRWDVAHIFREDAERGGLICIQRLIWDKCHWGMGDLRYYGSQTEDVLVFRKGAPLLNCNKRRGNIWSYPSKAAFPEGVFNHPAQKPLGVIREWTEHSTGIDKVVFDPFMGSGTTGVACMQLGRRFVGCEIDPGYFEIARKRIENAAMQDRLL
jgi:site-specific DNA-methyltransferase (adenine-specific)